MKQIKITLLPDEDVVEIQNIKFTASGGKIGPFVHGIVYDDSYWPWWKRIWNRILGRSRILMWW